MAPSPVADVSAATVVVAESPPSRQRRATAANGACRRTWLVAGLLLVLTFALFSRALTYGFVDYDDPDFVTANPPVRAGLTAAGMRWAFVSSGGPAANWQPIAWLSLMLDAQIYGVAAPGFHLTNVLLHSLNAVLVLLLLRRLGVSLRWSAVCAAVFAWHPLRVESVAWIAERKDVLSACFGLTCLLLYVGYRRASAVAPARRRLQYAGALAAFTLGLLSKPMLVTLPAVLVLIDVWLEPSRGIGSRAYWRSRGLEKVPFVLLALGTAVVTYRVQHAGGAFNRQFAWPHLVANALLSLVGYVEKTLWPAQLAVVYPHELAISAAATIGALLLLVATTVFLLRSQVRSRRALVGWLWFVGMLVPVLGFVPVGSQAMADRYTYLPSLGLLLAVAAFGDGRSWFRSRAATLLAVGALGALAATTWRQLGFWRDSTTLFAHALEVTSDNYLAETDYSTTLLERGQPAAAVAACRRALAINPDYAPAYYHLGAALEKTGAVAAALASYRSALRLSPEFAPAHVRLGYVLLHQHAAAEALGAFRAATALQPENADAWLGRSLACADLHRSAEALEAVQTALRLQPDFAAAENTLGNLLTAQGDGTNARIHYAAALRLDPQFAEAHYNLGNAFARAGDFRRAVVAYGAAVRLAPADADYHAGLAAACERLERSDDALREYRAAVRLAPDQAEVRYSLGRLLLERDDLSGAAEQFRAALRAQPDFGAAHLGLGAAEARLGHPDAALTEERRAVALSPDDATAHYFLGDTLRVAGHLTEAADEWAIALRLAPDLPGLADQLATLRQTIAAR